MKKNTGYEEAAAEVSVVAEGMRKDLERHAFWPALPTCRAPVLW